jgi:uncharacterized protein
LGWSERRKLAELGDEEREPIFNQLRAGALAGLPPSASFDPGNFCFASRPNSFVIRASGDIGKCTVALSDPANSIGRIHGDGTLEVRSEALAPWLRGWRGDPDALKCPLIGLPRGKGEPVMLQINVRPVSAGLGT